MISYILVAAFLIVGMLLSIITNKLTVTGAIAGGAVGFCIYLGASFTGLIMLAAFFILGTAATSWKRNVKTQLGLAQQNRGRRTAGQVLANAGVAALLGLYGHINDGGIVIQTMIAAAFASATADTLSSELGSVYGARFYNIITFKKDRKGLDGVVSFEGLIIGIAGSAIIAMIHSVSYGWNKSFLWIIIAGTAGNIADSILGATVERRGIIKNDLVNFFNTLIAAAIMYLILM